MATHYFSNAVQTKKKLGNNNGSSQEEVQKIQRRQSQMELRKEKRSLQIERNRLLTASDYSTFENENYENEDLNVPIETIVGELRNEYDRSIIMASADVVDSAAGRSDGNMGNHKESIARCLHLIQNKLKQENSGTISPPIPEVSIKSFVNSSLVECLVHDPQLSTFQIIVSLLKQEIIDSYSSNAHLCLELVGTIYLMTKFASSEQLQSMAKALVHEPLCSILEAKSDVDLCAKAFFCLSFIASNCKDLRLFLIDNGYASLISKHSEYTLNMSRNNDENMLNYTQSIAYSVRVFALNIGEKLSNIQFTSHILHSLNNLMQLNDDDLVVANVYWSLSYLAIPGPLFDSDFTQKSNLIPKLIEALNPQEHPSNLKMCKSEQVKEAAITCLANLTACSDVVANVVINCNFVRFDVIDRLVQSNSSVKQHQTVVTLINLVNANPSIVVQLTNGGIIAPLLDLFYLGEYKTRKEVTDLLRSIILKGNPEVAMELLRRDVISSLSVQLTVTEPDLILTTLEIYEHLLKLEKKRLILFDVAAKCRQLGVVGKMQKLLCYPNQVITDTCYRIYDDYIAPQDTNSEESMEPNAVFHF